MIADTGFHIDLMVEQQVIGSCLLCRRSCEMATNLIRPDFFFVDENRKIFEAINDLVESGVQPGEKELCSRLSKDFGAAEVGRLVAGCTFAAGTGTQIEFFIKELAAGFARRKLAEVNYDLAELANDPSLSLSELLERFNSLSDRVDSLGEFDGGSDSVSAIELAQRVIAEIDDRKHGYSGQRFNTGLTALDGIMGGLKPKKLVVLAARSGCGKSALASTLAVNTSIQSGAKCLFFTMEMADSEVGDRLVASLAAVNSRKVEHGTANKDEVARIWASRKKVDSAHIYFNDDSTQTPLSIFNACRKQKNKTGLDVVFIDYLQMLDVSRLGNKGDSSSLRYAEAARLLKNLSKDLNICVVALSQVNKDGEAKESGGIRDAADTLILMRCVGHEGKVLEREEQPRCTSESDFRLIEFDLSKNRGGEEGRVPPVKFYPAISHYEDREGRDMSNYSNFGDFGGN